MRSVLPLLLLWAASCCGRAARNAPVAPVAPHGDGDLYGWFESPVPGADLKVSVVAADGSVAASGAAPSGELHFRLASGRYRLEFAGAPGCSIPVEVRGPDEVVVNNQPIPRACRQVVRRIDARHPLTIGGSRADVKTRPGDYAGYRVLPCDPNDPMQGIFYVEGLGSRKPPDDADRKHDHEFDQWIDDERAHIDAAIAPMSGGAGFGVACRADRPASITVYVSDWRQADEVLRRLARVIHDDDLGVGFSVDLMGISEDL